MHAARLGPSAPYLGVMATARDGLDEFVHVFDRHQSARRRRQLARRPVGRRPPTLTAAIYVGGRAAELWRHAAAELWRHAAVELWRHAAVELWRHAAVELWRHAAVELWRHSAVELWRHAAVELWHHAAVELWRHAAVERTAHVTSFPFARRCVARRPFTFAWRHLRRRRADDVVSDPLRYFQHADHTAVSAPAATAPAATAAPRLTNHGRRRSRSAARRLVAPRRRDSRQALRGGATGVCRRGATCWPEVVTRLALSAIL